MTIYRFRHNKTIYHILSDGEYAVNGYNPVSQCYINLYYAKKHLREGEKSIRTAKGYKNMTPEEHLMWRAKQCV